MLSRSKAVATALMLAMIVRNAHGQATLAIDAHDLALTEGLAIDSTGRSGRRAINTDAVQAMLVEGTLGAVKEGDKVALPKALGGGEREWRRVKADEKGNFPGERAGWLLCTVESAAERVMVLEARGHAMVYVNGEARMGDPYSAGYMRLPVAMKKGENRLLFASAGRGGMSARLVEPKGEMEIVGEDLTVPDVVAGRGALCCVGVPVMNASLVTRRVTVTLETGGPEYARRTDVCTLPPCSVVKLPACGGVGPLAAGGEVKSAVRVGEIDGPVTASREITLRVVDGAATHKDAYLSRVDGSVQYYSVVPPGLGADGATVEHPAFVLSLHGASVEATNQAASYKAKPGTVIVCPTNRRPFGFDWEDWGRIDAIEVMDVAAKEFAADPARRYLTGHSMGGHGTWQLGVLYPERFAAIAPSAGWLSFDSYTNARPEAPKPEDGGIAAAFRCAAASCDTQAMMANLEGHGVYILHGDKDDNVPVEQARKAKEILEGLTIPFEYHEQPGAGHWWGDEHSGAACMDWPPIFEMFAKWELTGDAPAPKVEPPIDGRGFPRGSFKRVFDRAFVLVYGTKGTAEENAWSLAKARFDAEQWWYRGNGTARLASDDQVTEWHHGHEAMPGNVVLYGNADTNGAWALIGSGLRARVARGEFRAGGRTLHGDDLGCLCAEDVGVLTIGIVGGTGLKGMRAMDRVPYFSSGAGVPEVMVVRSGVWTEGIAGVEGVSDADRGGGAMAWREGAGGS